MTRGAEGLVCRSMIHTTQIVKAKVKVDPQLFHSGSVTNSISGNVKKAIHFISLLFRSRCKGIGLVFTLVETTNYGVSCSCSTAGKLMIHIYIWCVGSDVITLQ